MEESQQNYGVFRRRRPIRLARARSSVADVGGLVTGFQWPATNSAIQRAPSRLYRLHDHQLSPSPSSAPSPPSFQPRKSQSFRDLNREVAAERTIIASAKEAATCSGPEFIVKSSLAACTLTLPHQPKKVRCLLISSRD